jgi:hypothetical protein
MLRHGTDSFTSPPKEVVLRIFIVVKYLSISAGFKPAKLGPNGKHDNHYTTENDNQLIFIIVKRAFFDMDCYYYYYYCLIWTEFLNIIYC